RAVGYVTGESSSVDLITRRYFASDAFRLVAAASVHDSHMCALLRERVADALPQPAIAARHQCNRALQVHHFSPLMRMRCRIAAASAAALGWRLTIIDSSTFRGYCESTKCGWDSDPGYADDDAA